MSALLRHGVARRLGGSMVQRAQAAAAEERRRHRPRLMHTDESVRKEVMLEIQQKKEELYNVISMVAEKEHRIINWWNRKLLQELSVQVTPRPYDSKWCWTRNAKRWNGAMVTAGRVSLSSALAYAVFLLWPLAEKEKPVLTSKGSGDNM